VRRQRERGSSMRAARGLLVVGSGEGESAGAAHVRDLRRRGSPEGRSLEGWGREERNGGGRSRHLVVGSRHLVVDIIIQAWKEGDESVPTSCRRSDCVAASSLPFPQKKKKGDGGGETEKMDEPTNQRGNQIRYLAAAFVSSSLSVTFPQFTRRVSSMINQIK
jgi:hypothetical protein